MKKITTLMLLLLSCVSLFAQVKIGEAVSPVTVPLILNAPVETANLGNLKGKVIWLELWATWCSPCVDAMPHLQQLQKAFKGKLQVITVSEEKPKRIKQFLQNKPSNLWFGVDTAGLLRKDFPCRTIPHSVLIDEHGVVVAITEPANITAKVISDVLAGRKIDLPVKVDNMVSDPWATYFPANPATKSHFIVQPKIDGAASGSRSYLNDSTFKNRRLSMMNLPLETAYRVAYGDLPYGRTIDLTPKENVKENKTMYCIDIIVPKGQEAELLPTLQKELKARFDLQAGIEKRTKPVYVLSVADKDKVAKLQRSTAKQESFAASHGIFQGEDVRFKKIADYLEGFGLTNLPVVDETRDTAKYDINFSFMPEKKGDLENTLQNMGFKLTKADREIDMLVFR